MHSRNVTTPARAAKEVTQKLKSVLHKIGHSVVVVLDESPEVTELPLPETVAPPKKYRTIVIEGDLYKEFMAEKPAWSDKKPKNEFRGEDIFLFVDVFSEQLS